ncbi:hypothetical protein ABIB90_005600 [Bradyrhizobium sp. JR4.1]
MGGFARDAPKPENGFISVRIVSSGSGDDIFDGKSQSFQMGRAPTQCGLAGSGRVRMRAGTLGAVMIPPHSLHMRFTFFC